MPAGVAVATGGRTVIGPLTSSLAVIVYKLCSCLPASDLSHPFEGSRSEQRHAHVIEGASLALTMVTTAATAIALPEVGVRDVMEHSSSCSSRRLPEVPCSLRPYSSHALDAEFCLRSRHRLRHQYQQPHQLHPRHARLTNTSNIATIVSESLPGADWSSRHASHCARAYRRAFDLPASRRPIVKLSIGDRAAKYDHGFRCSV